MNESNSLKDPPMAHLPNGEKNSIANQGYALISVIVPVFNRPEKIHDCVNSVFEQTYRPIELILVDDGSTDATPQVLTKFEENYHRKGLKRFDLRVIRQANAGAPAARNRGFRESRGEWIQFLDSDDQLLPSKLTNAIVSAQQTGAELVYSKAQYIDQAGNRLPQYRGRKLTGDWRDHFEFSWQTMCALYSREAIITIGPWNEDLPIFQDWEFCIRAITSGVSIHFDDEVTSLYMSEGSDRIGSQITLAKNHGREIALWKVRTHLQTANLMPPELNRRFRSRLIHVLLYYRMLGDEKHAKEIAAKMRREKLLPSLITSLLQWFPNRWFTTRLLTFFQQRIAKTK